MCVCTNWFSGYRPPTAFTLAEEGKMPIDDKFYARLEKDLKSIRTYRAYQKKIGQSRVALPQGVEELNGKEFFAVMMGGAKSLDPVYLNAIKKLKEAGFITAALTNNTPSAPADTVLSSQSERIKSLRSLLHPFMESSKLALRKPNPLIYDHAIKEIGCKPEEIVFLDDIGINLKVAKSKGIQTIKVNLGHTHDALKELEAIVGIPLLDEKAKL